jgi:hypothetical protein
MMTYTLPVKTRRQIEVEREEIANLFKLAIDNRDKSDAYILITEMEELGDDATRAGLTVLARMIDDQCDDMTDTFRKTDW